MDDEDMPAGLVRSDPSGPGFTRRRHGRGFGFRDDHGQPVTDPDVVHRVKGLVIPPAWQEVWISPDPAGHIQAVGTDAAGRRQYRYHDDWTTSRDADKYDRVLGLGRRMRGAREVVHSHLAKSGLTRERVLAGAVRLLDIGVFRAGGEEYAPGADDEEGTFGLATLRREHVRLHRGAVLFAYAAKGDVPRTLELHDEPVHRLVNGLLRRRGGGEDLLAYRTGRDWHDVRAEDLNAAVKELVGRRYTAKDLRTWNGTVLAAVALARAAADRGVPASAHARGRMITAAIREVSEHLGNTPAVARSSYVDPRVVERFENGATVLPALRRVGAEPPGDADRAALERAVIRLIRAR